MYRALSTRPDTKPTGLQTIDHETGERVGWERVVGWRVLGTLKARDEFDALQQAKKRWGGSPVIQALLGMH